MGLFPYLLNYTQFFEAYRIDPDNDVKAKPFTVKFHKLQGSDGSFNPPEPVTEGLTVHFSSSMGSVSPEIVTEPDASGVYSTVLTISKTPGEHIISFHADVEAHTACWSNDVQTPSYSSTPIWGVKGRKRKNSIPELIALSDDDTTEHATTLE